VETAAAATPSLLDHILGSGFVVQFVLIILILLSVLSWAIMISKALQLRKAKAESEEFSNIFWETRNLARVDDTSRRLQGSPLVRLFISGYRELMQVLQEKEGVVDLSTVQSAMDRAEVDEMHRLERGVTFLATTASAAPFIGLFGTVWGIMNAFHGLSFAKNTTIQAVAPGISEALVATAVGLAAAIPAAVGYNYFSVAIRQLRQKMDSFISEFVNIARRNVVTK
jgi:biopolymer transport protein TolQ